MRFRFIPLEERIVLDAAGTSEVVNSYALEHHQLDAPDVAHEMNLGPVADPVDHSPGEGDSSSGNHIIVVSSQVTPSQASVDEINVKTIYYNPEQMSAQQLIAEISQQLEGKLAEGIAFINKGSEPLFQLSNDSLDLSQQDFLNEVSQMVKRDGTVEFLEANRQLEDAQLKQLISNYLERHSDLNNDPLLNSHFEFSTHFIETSPLDYLPDSVDGTHVLVVSSDVKDAQLLVEAAKSSVPVVLYDPHTTSLEELSAAIKTILNGKQADSIAFVGYGTNGEFNLTDGQKVTLETLQSAEMRAFWNEIGQVVREGGRIDILGCSVAAGGQELLTALDNVTDHNLSFAASTDQTGNLPQANWILENGNIDVGALYFDMEEVVAWAGVLDTLQANNDTVSAFIGLPVDIRVMNNDTRPSNTQTQISIQSQPSQGTLSLFNETFRYTPNSNALGTDTFTYKLSSQGFADSIATVTINLENLTADTLVVKNNAAPADLNTPVTIDLTGDIYSKLPSNNLQIMILSSSGGTVDISGGITNVIYTPETDFKGAGSFSYKVKDAFSSLESNVGIYIIGVGVVDSNTDQPGIIANHDVLITSQSLSKNVLANDFNPGFTVQSVQIVPNAPSVGAAPSGTYSVDNLGNFTYNGSGSGFVSYTFTTTNGQTSSVGLIYVDNVPSASISTSADSFTINNEGPSVFNVMSNDSGASSSSTNIIETQSQKGLVIAAAQSFIYIPFGDTGADSFTYRVLNDNGQYSDPTTVSLNLTPRASTDSPSASGDTILNPRNEPITLNVLSNDFVASGSSISLYSNPSHGNLILNPDGTFRYTPMIGYIGQDSFTYTLNNVEGRYSTATVNIAVGLIANSDVFQTSENQSVVIDVLANDYSVYAAKENLGISVIDNIGQSKLVGSTPVLVSHGTVRLDPTTQMLIYTPNPGFTGVETLEYQIVNGTNVSNISIVNIAVGLQRPDGSSLPIANSDLVLIPSNSSNVSFNVLSNDYNSQFNAQIRIVQPPQYAASLVLNNGSFTYTPNAGFTGSDSFTYQFSNDGGTTWSNTSTVTILRDNNQSSDRIQVSGDSFQVLNRGSIALDVLGNDPGASLTSVNVLYYQPSHGKIIAGDKGFIYIADPTSSYIGPDQFGYQVYDSVSGQFSYIHTVQLNIIAQNILTANTDNISLTEDQSVNNLNVLDNDGSLPAGSFISLYTKTAHGILNFNHVNNTFNYTPHANYYGFDSFTYTVTDGLGNISTASASFTLIPVDDGAPSAPNSFYQIAAGATLTFNPLSNATNPDGNPFSVNSITATNGTVNTNAATGEVTFTPSANFSGLATVTYTLADVVEQAQGLPGVRSESNLITVYIAVGNNFNINVRNDVAFTDSFQNIGGSVLANDTSLHPNIPLTATLISSASSAIGTLSLDSNGFYTFVPNGNEGIVSYEYRATDAFGKTAIGTLTMTSANGPIAISDAFPTALNTPVRLSELLVNDSNPFASNLSIEIVKGPSHGTVDATFYTPETNFRGVDSFTYRLFDGQHYSDETLVIVGVGITNNSGNPGPIANSDLMILPNNSVNLIANDFNPGGTLQVSLVDLPDNGSYTLDEQTGLFTYNGSGPDSFSYRFSLDGGTTYSNTVTVRIVDTAPTLAVSNDSYTISENNGVLSVLSNDGLSSDVINVLVSAPTNGSIIAADRGFLYFPSISSGSDSFQYRAYNPATGEYSELATVTLTIDSAGNNTFSGSAFGDSVSNPSRSIIDINVLANDYVGIGSTIRSYTNPLHGTLSLNFDGTFKYTPHAGYSGQDSFTYTLSAGDNNSTTATVLISVGQIPVANNDFEVVIPIAAGGTGSVIVGLLDNDYSLYTARENLQVTITEQPEHGTLRHLGGGAFEYQPDVNFSGMESFKYVIVDQNNKMSNEAVVQISVNMGNTFANSDLKIMDSIGPVSLNVSDLLANDVNVPVNSNFVYGTPQHGTLQLNNGVLTYTPGAGFTGQDSFTYYLTNGASTISNTAQVTIQLDTGLSSIITSNDALQVGNFNTSIYHSVLNVLGNDPTSNSSTMNILVSNALHGDLYASEGGFLYIPDLSYQGFDQFTYRAYNPTTGQYSDPTMVQLNVVNVPRISSILDSVSTPEDTSSLNIEVLKNDQIVGGGPLPANTFVSLYTSPSHGSLVLNADNTFTYTPHANYSGTDSFTYTINNGLGLYSGNSVSITMTPVQDAPVANDDLFSVNVEGGILIPVLQNDSDVDGDTLVIQSFTQGRGRVEIGPNGNLLYENKLKHGETDTFTYTVSDGNGGTDTATVTIVANTLPIARDDIGIGDSSTIITGNVLTNDFDADGSTLSATDKGVLSIQLLPSFLSSNEGSLGALTLNSNGTYTFTPNGIQGIAVYQYEVSDGLLGGKDTGTLTITVLDRPVAVSDVIASNQEIENILKNDFILSDNVSIEILLDPQHGTMTTDAAGKLIYTPSQGYTGFDSFTYRLFDGQQYSDSALVVIGADLAQVPPRVLTNNDIVLLDSDTAPKSIDVQMNDAFRSVTGVNINLSALTDRGGTLSVQTDATGYKTILYTPPAGGLGQIDHFTYTLSYQLPDGSMSTSHSSTVTIIPTTMSQPSLTANADTFEVYASPAQIAAGSLLLYSLDVLGNDTSPSATASVVVTSDPLHGQIYLSGRGIYYQATQLGLESFSYRIVDTFGNFSNEATVNITVKSTNSTLATTLATTNDSILGTEDVSINNITVLNNDNFANGATISRYTQAAHGQVSLNSNGSFNYVPDANYHGSDSFTYTLSDGKGDFRTATVSITLASVNDQPVAQDHTYNTLINTNLSFNILTYATDVDGDSLVGSFTSSINPSQGSIISGVGAGNYIFIPASNFNGIVNLNYSVTDGVLSDTGIISIVVNNPPVAVDDVGFTQGSTQISGNVLTNDTDQAGNTLSAHLISNGTSSLGVLTLSANGTYTFNVASGNAQGVVSYQYEVSDNFGAKDTGTLTISVINQPIAVSDVMVTDVDTTLDVTQVLFNDYMPYINNALIQVEVLQGPSHGTLSDSIFNLTIPSTYTPDSGFTGVDSFTYRLYDGHSYSSIAVVAIGVGVDQTPLYIANSDVAFVNGSSPVNIDVLANDYGTLNINTINLISSTSQDGGTLSLSDGKVVYTPPENFDGLDSFTYTFTTNGNTSTIGTVKLISTSQATMTANGDAFEVSNKPPTALNVLSNDTSLSATASAIILMGPSHGSLIDAGKGLVYAPDDNSSYVGPDSFTYIVVDANGNYSNTATVNLNIIQEPANSPVANDDSITVLEDSGSFTVNVLSNDILVNDATISLYSFNRNVNHVLSDYARLNSNGTFTFTPPANFNGNETFIYVLNDGKGQYSVGHLNITITPQNDAPIVVDDVNFGDGTENLTGNVLDNDVDVDSGDTFTATLLSSSSSSIGELTLNLDGSYVFVPTPDAYGTAIFNYRVTDSTGLTNDGKLTITLAPDGSLTAVEDTFTANEDQSITGNVLANDISNLTLSAELVDKVTHGVLTLNADGSFTYTPNANFNGTDSFTYKARNSENVSDPVTVTLNVTAINDVPVANPDSISLLANEEVEITVSSLLANDTDADGDTVSIVGLGELVQHGTLSYDVINAKFTYQPNLDYVGQDSFVYAISDGKGGITTGTVSFTISDPLVNGAPIAATDSLSTAEDTALIINTSTLLANDSDPNGNAISFFSVSTTSAHGTIVNNGNGTITYTPSANYNGSDSFTYTIIDSRGTTGTGTVNMTITAVNDAPVARDDTAEGTEDTTISGKILENDTDIDSATLTAILATNPTHGTVTLIDGSFTYTPNANYYGTDSFTYRANDGTTSSQEAKVTITINPVNDAPVAIGDAYSLDEDTTLTISAPGVFANDSNPDGDSLIAVVVEGPSHGSLNLDFVYSPGGFNDWAYVINSDGSFTYTPDLNYNGNDSFTYRLYDSTLLTSQDVTVSLTIRAVNDAPVANVDNYETNEDTPLTVLASGVLANDTDVENNALTAIKITNPSNGSVFLGLDGAFIYTPTENYTGSDSFSYLATDGTSNSALQTVNITVKRVNDAPVAVADSYSTNEDTALTITTGGVLANDTDVDNNPLTLTAVKLTDPAHGTLTLNANGTFTYTPFANYHGSDSFTYKVNDGSADSAPATVSITVNSINDAPVARTDSYGLHMNTTLTVNAPGVLANDTDVDGDALSANLLANTQNGILEFNSDGSFTYTPAGGFSGNDSFTYNVYDGTIHSQFVTVTLAVTAENAAPVARNDTYSVNEDTTLTVSVPGLLSNDSDLEGDALNVSVLSSPNNGTLSWNADGSFTYTPNANFNGTDGFVYQAYDSSFANSNVASVIINVTSVNDRPVASGTSINGNEDTTMFISVIASDVENSPLTYIVVDQPSHGTVSYDTFFNSFKYIPAANYNGPDSFTYKVNDGSLDSLTATVNITVFSVADHPTTGLDFYEVNKNGTLTVDAAQGVLSNDTDPDNLTPPFNAGLTANLSNGPSHGTLSFNSDGSFIYTPHTNYVGTDHFSYSARDGGNIFPITTVTLTIRDFNTAPVAVNDSYLIEQGNTLTVNIISSVLVNDTDIDQNSLTAILVSDPTNGTLSFAADGSFIYTPAANFLGTDSFTYKVNDGNLDSQLPATVTITVYGANDIPVANNDSYSTDEDTPLTINAPGVLFNDTDNLGFGLTASVVTNPLHGTLTLNANGSFTYTPDFNYNGSDSFTYKVSDGLDFSAEHATVSLTIRPVNDAPTIDVNSYSTNEDTPLVVNAPGLLGNDSDVDGDPITAALVTGPSHGSINLNADGSFTYTPHANYHGQDFFTYKINDGKIDGTSNALVTINITAVSDAPVANADSYSTNEDTAIIISDPALGLLANDTDLENDSLTAIKVTNPVRGTVVINSNGTFTYTPFLNSHGTDSFTYKANDGFSDSAPTTVTITINSVEDAPVARNETFSVQLGDSLRISVPSLLANDTDAEGDTISFGGITSTGRFTPIYSSSTNTISYFASNISELNGTTDSFTYKITDENGGEAIGTVTINLSSSAVNNAPYAGVDQLIVEKNTPLTFNSSLFLANDSDPDGDSLIISLAFSQTSSGTLTSNGSGFYTYTPATNYTGPAFFTYEVQDFQFVSPGSRTVGFVDITVMANDHVPLAVNDTAAVNEGESVLINVLANDSDGDLNDSISISSFTQGSQGAVTLQNGQLKYTLNPNNNFNGTDTFSYTVRDLLGKTSTATVTVNVAPVNDAPVARNETFSVQLGDSLRINVLSLLFNDTDSEGDTISFSGITSTGRFTPVYSSASNTISYFASNISELNGTTDSFTYAISDGNGGEAIGTVTINLSSSPVNNVPFAGTDQLIVEKNTPLTFNSSLFLANDSDPDLDSLIISLAFSQTSSGTLTSNGGGFYTYTPATNYTGPAFFTYEVQDFQFVSPGSRTVGFVDITIVSDDHVPVAVNDTAAVNEGESVLINVLANDSDGDSNDKISISSFTQGSQGAVTLQNGQLKYTLNSTNNFNGTDTFSYTVRDLLGNTSTATVTVNVAPVNDAPVAVENSFNAQYDGTIEISLLSLLGNDTDVDGDTLSFVRFSSGSTDGNLSYNSTTGMFIYEAPTFPILFSTNDSFTYTISDGKGGQATGTVTINLSFDDVNNNPFAATDYFTVTEEGSVVFSADDLMSNDHDPDGDNITNFTITSVLSNGILIDSGGGTITYKPNTNYNGTDSFTYSIRDTNGGQSTGTVIFTVTPVNDAPTAHADAYELNKNTSLQITLFNQGILANDTDIEGSTLSASLVAGKGPAHGTLVLNADGTFLYTPTANYVGNDSFTYQASDGDLFSAETTVSLTIKQTGNQPPVAMGDSYTLSEDATLTIDPTVVDPTGNFNGVLSNDSDPEGSGLTAVLVGNVSHGTLTFNANGSFTYKPALNYNGTDSFTYKANDGSLDSNVVTVTLNIIAVNDAPVAVSDSYSTNEGTTLADPTRLILSNDSDVEGSTLSAVLVSGPSHGTLDLNSNGFFTYTPAAGFKGVDGFIYKASDGSLTSAETTVSITVIPNSNRAPVAVNNSYTVAEDGTLSIAAKGVLANDTDADGNVLTAVLVDNVTHGSLTLNANGSFVYKPAANYSGTDTFTYRANDGFVNSNLATVTITVTAVNDAPIAANDSYTVAEDTTLIVAASGVLGNDSDPEGKALTAVIVSRPTHGTLTLNANGSFTYKPFANYSGADSFTYRAKDGVLTSNLATVTINVTAVNDVPVAVNNTYTMTEDGTLTVTGTGVLGNDTDADKTPLTAVLVSNVSHGTLTLNANGSFVYKPAANYNGTDTFTYKANDGTIDSNVATVTIKITSVNDAPLATNDTYTVNEDSTLTIATANGVLSNDSDPEGSALTAVIVTRPTHGTLTLNANGSFTYKPFANYSGPDSFTYRAKDASLLTGNLATVNINVLPVNDVPVAVNNTYTIAEDNTLTVTGTGVLANDTDADKTPLTATLTQGALHGAITLNPNGSFTYIPMPNYSGSDSFSYRAFDGTDVSNEATVTINVTAVNDTPIANNDSYTARENTTLTLTLIENGVLSNDSDAEGAITAVLATGPANGTLTLNANGTFIYKPNTNFVGFDSFTYQAKDATTLKSNIATVTINVKSLAPLANADSYSTTEDTTLTIDAFSGVLANDSEDFIFATSVVTGPSHGSLSLNTNGSFTYTPTANYYGLDSFTYKVNNGLADSNVATVTLTINGVNDAAPVAVEDTFSVQVLGQIVISAYALIANDTDVDGDPLSFVRVNLNSASHGNLTYDANTSKITYQSTEPAIPFRDRFTYVVSDGQGGETTGTVTLNLSFDPVNQLPFAAPDTFTITEDTSLPLSVATLLNNDTYDSTVVGGYAISLTGASHGHFSFGNNSFDYIPDANYTGIDSFTYTLTDRHGTSTAKVTINVTPVNDAPIGVADAYDAVVNKPLQISTAAKGILSNDSDAEGSALTANLVSGPTHGTLVLNADGTFLYTPTANYVGSDQFTYQASDGDLSSSEVVVSLRVHAVSDIPVAKPDSYILNYNPTDPATLAVDALNGVLKNDTDINPGTTLSAILVSGPSHGTLSLNSDGSFSYTATPGFTGTDSFTYNAHDGGLTSTLPATVNITLNQNPILQLDSTPVSYTENAIPVLLNSSVTVSDDVVSFNQDQLIVKNLTATDITADRLSIVSNLKVKLSGTSVLYNGIIVGSYTGGNGATPLVITFNSRATTLAVQDITKSIGFSNTSQDPSNVQRSIQFNFRDAQGGLSIDVVKQVTVYTVNDAPVIKVLDSTISVVHNVTTSIGISTKAGLSLTDIDLTNSNELLSIALAVDHGTLSLSSLTGLSNLQVSTTTTGSSNGMALILKGTLADINLALTRIQYLSQSGYVGTDTMVMTAVDNGVDYVQPADLTQQLLAASAHSVSKVLISVI